MGFIEIKEKEKIAEVLHHLISKNVELSVDIKGSDGGFKTRLVKLEDSGLGRKLIIEKFYPETGNSLIQAALYATLSFDLGKSKGVFQCKYLGINTQYPEFGLILDVPVSIKMENKRREERIENGFTKFFSVEFTLEEDGKLYQLGVVNLSAHGVGLIVDEGNFDLLEKVNVGDTVKDLRFFLKAAVLTTDGVVRHKTKVKNGKLQGKYILGIQSEFIIDLDELKDKLKEEM
jgi:hypothetical protein